MNQQQENNAYDTLVFIKKFFNENGISLWMDGGAALCIHRDGNLSHERDVDIGILAKDSPKLIKLIPTLKKYLNGFEIRMMDHCSKVRSFRSLGILGKEPIKTDIYLWYPEEEFYMIFQSDYYISIPKRFIDKLDVINYRDIELMIPSPIEGFLEYLYGPTWKIKMSVAEWKIKFPKKNLSNHGRPALRINNEGQKYGY